MDESDELTLRQWLAALARRHWLLVASLAAHGVILLVLPRLWTLQIEGSSRSGRSFMISAASRDLIFAALGAGLYVIAGLGAPHHWAMTPPTEGEIKVARWFVRGLGLVLLWLALVVTVRA